MIENYFAALGGVPNVGGAVPAAQAAAHAATNNTLQARLHQTLAIRQRQQQMQSDYAQLLKNPDTQAVNGFLTAYPEISATLASGWNALHPGQRDAALQANADIYNYLKNGDTNSAITTLQNYAQATRKSGGDVTGFPALIAQMRRDPGHAQALAGMSLAAGMQQSGDDSGDDNNDSNGGGDGDSDANNNAGADNESGNSDAGEAV